ncbi:glycosyltransferase [Schinkia azotoformans]|uniref:glycosyltransferase n=1 Tax=Schinkia azotoformans TaxID=1454 RepID=UPI002DB634B3|nr:glycosyltransferase [Schinkia azotoformans]MEC1714854.1 glycosyltransferase [Schinkia azotoformans]
MALISVVVPVYKTRYKYLRRCIDSLVSQTLSDIEIILVNDGSPDNCGEICEEYSLKDLRIKVIHQVNQGVSVARNNGINAATSKWITFVDADDWCELDMCEKIFLEAEKEKSDILLFALFRNTETSEIRNYYFDKSIGNINGPLKEELQLKTMIKYSPDFSYSPNNLAVAATWGKLYSLSFIKTNGLYYKKELLRSQDLIFNINAFEMANKITYLHENLYHYRRGSNESAVNTYRADILNIFLRVLRELNTFIKVHQKNTKYIEAYNIRSISYLYESLILDFCNKSNPQKKLMKYKRIKEAFELEPFRSAISNINLNKLTQKQKVLAFLFRKKMVLTLWALTKIIRSF